MTETEQHPYEPGKKLKFGDFQRFIHLESVDPGAALAFTTFLKELFKKTSEVWQPGSCRVCSFLEEGAKIIAGSRTPRDIVVEPRHWLGDSHFWLVAKFVEGPELIIDPFGVPTVLGDHYENPRSITPFFGNKDQAPRFAQRVYQEGGPLDARGYHFFTP